jgi:allophanate hydrolase subunit 2
MRGILDFFEIEKPAASMKLQLIPDLSALIHGVPAGGAMDPLAPVLLNRILGSASVDPVFEFTLQGPILVARKNLIVALGGMEGCAGPLPVWEPFRLSSGDLLNLRSLKGSCRIYLNAIPDTKSNYRLMKLTPQSKLRHVPDIPSISVLKYPRLPHTVEWSGSIMRVSADSDRRGLRLIPTEPLKGGQEIPPEPMGYGAIQLPPNGYPIIVGPDGPITGGYLRMATVMQADLRKLAYLSPGQDMDFTVISFEEAHSRLAATEDMLARDLIPC